MAPSKVYFTDLHATFEENLFLQKLARLARTAGMETLDFKNRYAAIKIHFGEPGNLAYLRPNYARVLVDMIKKQGGRTVPDRLQYLVCRTPEKCAGIIWMPPMRTATTRLSLAVRFSSATASREPTRYGFPSTANMSGKPRSAGR